MYCFKRTFFWGNAKWSAYLSGMCLLFVLLPCVFSCRCYVRLRELNTSQYMHILIRANTRAGIGPDWQSNTNQYEPFFLIHTNPFTMYSLVLMCIWILTVCISIKSQYRVNTDQSIHDVFASIRAYCCVFVCIERGLICTWILTVCIRSVFEKTLDGLVCIESVLNAQRRMY